MSKKLKRQVKERPIFTVQKYIKEWENPERVERWQKELEDLGFIAGMFIRVTQMVFVPARLFLHENDHVYCILYDDAQSTWIDFYSTQT